MPLKLIAVQGMTVITDPTTTIPPLFPNVVATIVVAPPTGIKNKGENKLVHRDGDQITVSAITVPAAGATIPDPASYTVPLNATALKTKAEGVLVLRQDDQSDLISATPQIPSTPDPIDYPVSFKCKISVAGQIKSKAQ
ncbi:hypothetical protein GWN42_13560 [candidate division KSB1 bacterium]|nr:hypothetical protein [candidate division KSB1 bacterium]